jgi:hypothetical protein
LAPKLKPLKPGRTEAQVLAGVLDAARVLGIDIDRQNTGAGSNPRGQTVRFGTPGNSDLTGLLPDGRKLDIEVKREGFDPSKLKGEKAEHFARQSARLNKTNALGGVGFWVDDAADCLEILKWVLDGGSVEERDGGMLLMIPGRKGSE